MPGRGGVSSRKGGGFALIFVLAMLVLVMGLVLAFFSKVVHQRQLSLLSYSAMQGTYLSEVALETILEDLRHEVEAGSEPDSMIGAEINVWRPRLVEVPGVNVPAAPSIIPQRSGDQGIRNIVKVSRRQTPFFAGGAGYGTPTNRTATGKDRATATATTDVSLNGRSMLAERWLDPRMMSEEESQSFLAPDWIYLDRRGKQPNLAGTVIPEAVKSPAAGNDEKVVGRYAYVIYDLGGLIDVNAVGNGLDESSNAERGFLHQVSLEAGLPLSADETLGFPNFTDFVGWRWPASQSANQDAFLESLFSGRRNFMEVEEGDQALLGRADLIRMANLPGASSPIPPAGLSYLTTFTRDADLPSHAPPQNEAGGPLHRIPNRSPGDTHDYFAGGATPQTELDPSLLADNIRFQEDVVLNRPEGPILAPAGTTVMPRRFPLGKIALLSEETPDPDELLYYFGLKKLDDGRFEYVAQLPDQANQKKLASLNMIALHRESTMLADPAGSGRMLPVAREPNFFEVVQAVILAGSLGKTAGSPAFNLVVPWNLETEDSITPDQHHWDNTSVRAHLMDRLRNKQALQIGANIIDQWDRDDFPTTIVYESSGNAPIQDLSQKDTYWAVYGIENLPYISTYTLVANRPDYTLGSKYAEPAAADGKDFLQLWACFDIWNPHKNAKVPEGIEAFRIVGSGHASGSTRYTITDRFNRATSAPATSPSIYYPLEDNGVVASGSAGDQNVDSFVRDAYGAMATTSPHGGTKASGSIEIGTTTRSDRWTIDELNEQFGLEFQFSAEEIYAEPTALWSVDQPPESEDDVPGVLLMHLDLRGPGGSSAAIPLKNQRPDDLQRTLNFLFDRVTYAPYTASVEVTLPSGDREVRQIRTTDGNGNSIPTATGLGIEQTLEGALVSGVPVGGGDRIYPFGTTFGGQIDRTINGRRCWIVVRPEPSAANPEPDVRVYANPPTKAQNWIRFIPNRASNRHVNFSLEALIDGEWVPYQTIEGWFALSSTFGQVATGIDSMMNPLIDPHHSDQQAALTFPEFYQHYGWRSLLHRHASTTADVSTRMGVKSDPRSSRFGWSYFRGQRPGEFLRSQSNPSVISDWLLTNDNPSRSIGRNTVGSTWASYSATNPPPNAPGFEHFSTAANQTAVGGLISNNPDLPMSVQNPMRYADIDGVIRPADGYWGALPTVPGQTADRSIILNRPFRSVGELGHVFRDSPWRTLDFSTPYSGDLGLLDVFSLNATDEPTATVAGRLDLNTREPAVLEVALKKIARADGSVLSDEDAKAIAAAIVEESSKAPFSSKGDLVARNVVASVLDTNLTAGNRRKPEREAAIRTLSGVGMTGTWNLLIDLVTQTGAFTPASRSASEFFVRSENRLWVHLALDRFTGRVVDIQIESFNE